MKNATLILACAALLVGAGTSLAQHPYHPYPPRTPYLVLRPPQRATRQSPHPYNRAPVQVTTRRGYAYGWFGAQPRVHYTRHFGYRRSYTQWTAR